MRNFLPAGQRHDDLKALLDGASVLVTGGTGSFGRRFIARLLTEFNCKRVAVFSRDELKQFEMQQDEPFRNNSKVRFFIGDVRDRERLTLALRGVDYVVHAAALKQVPAAEYNPFECIHTNVFGAENIVRAAMDTGVKRLVALSTDKAASPVNLYGASKLAADKIFVAANNFIGSTPIRFAVVRYGNVVGSRGSVVPFFRKLVEDGAATLPITDPRMTRFWITLDQGVDFVLSSLLRMQGGEIFIPKIPSMKVVDIATAIAPGARQEVVGIRPGEKLHEVMVTEDDARNTTEVEDCYIINPAFRFSEIERKTVGTPVAENFRYASDTNDEWLSAGQLGEMIAGY